MPQTNVDKWTKKFRANVERDLRARSQLQDAGWRVFVVWECELGTVDARRLVGTKLAQAIRGSG